MCGRFAEHEAMATGARGDRSGIQTLYDVDPAVSDDERAAWFVPPLADKRRMIEAMNAAHRR